MMLSDAQPIQAGAYEVEIENAAGSVTSSEVSLTVYQAPVIITQPSDRLLNQGQSTSLNVSVEGTEPLSYAWWFNGNPLPGATVNTLSLTALQGAQSGSYWVV